ncbi:MAG: hypothetical protein CMI74_03035 [Candidatus Pelagibacter sp.]|nr:hypothetical protein [Candidatus Pelagibacter sp.]OUW11701.1 MAG: hypothetical protein CBD26_01265 [Candidatus Pelagibacter sp. TMED166]|tara:strand:- start:10716 stop:11345 length:630 start_codon:yes stop_codon:yes gene_type:complete
MTNKPLKKPEKKSLIAKIRNYFLAGVVVMIPIAATVYLTIFIINISEKILPKSINPNQYLPFDIPGLEIFITFIILTLIGLLSLTFLGKRLLLINEKILNKIPILRTIYNGLGQLTKSFTNKDNSNKKIVLLEYPRKGIWSIGFATNENEGEISDKLNRKLVNVFVPTTPNPTSGFLLMVPKEDLISLDMNFEDASKFIMSAGSINPKK